MAVTDVESIRLTAGDAGTDPSNDSEAVDLGAPGAIRSSARWGC